MEKQFVTYQQAKDLKEIGFDELCFGQYENESKILSINFNNTPLTDEQKKRPGLYSNEIKNSIVPQWAIAAPLKQQFFDWVSENYNINCYTKPQIIFGKKIYDYYIWFPDNNEENSLDLSIGMNNEYTRDEAESSCINEVIEMIKVKVEAKN
jgi:hypothetical protein